MSAPIDRPVDPGSVSLYAPKWAREAKSADPTDTAPGLVPDERPRSSEPKRLPSTNAYPFEGDLGIQQLRARRSLDPNVVPQPPLRVETRSRVSSFVRPLITAAVAAVAALLAVGQFPPPSAWFTAAADRLMELAASAWRPVRPPASAQRKETTLPRLAIEGARGVAGEAASIGVALHGPSEGTVALVSGILAGTTLSSGQASGANAWRVPAAELSNTRVVPPQGFAGPMNLAIELRLSDDTVVDRRTVRIEWVAKPEPASSAHPAPRQLDGDEIATLIKRGEEFIATGDLAAARLMLQRAAEARNPRAALALAGTYDPLVLAKLPVYGFAPDLAMARAWYEKAKEFGSEEASGRLELLASQAR